MIVKRLRIPNPFPSGRTSETSETNVYVINDETIFDVGISSDKTTEILKNSIEDFDKKLIISHAHVDHFGSAYLFDEIYAHKNTCLKLKDAEEEYFRLVHIHFLNEGVPLNLIEKMKIDVEREFRKFIKPTDKCKLIGDKVRIGNDIFKVIHTPGHSYSHICLYNKDSKSIFCGDTLLKNTIPSPIIEPIDEFERYDVMSLYLETLEKLISFDIKKAYPGHGNPILKHDEIIFEYIDNWERRSINVWEILDGRTAFEVTTDLFPRSHLFLSMTKIIAIIDFLHSKGFVERREDREGRRVYFKVCEVEDIRELWRKIRERMMRKAGSNR